MAKRYGRRDASQWQALIERQQASDQSQAAFCRARGLALSTFTYWRRRLRRGGVRAAANEAQAERDAPVFAPLTLPEGAERADPESDAGWEMELELGHGLRLRMRRLAG